MFINMHLLIYSYNKNQRDALFLKFIFDKGLYKLRTDLLSIIRSLNSVYTAIDICHTGYIDCLTQFHPDLSTRQLT